MVKAVFEPCANHMQTVAVGDAVAAFHVLFEMHVVQIETMLSYSVKNLLNCSRNRSLASQVYERFLP